MASKTDYKWWYVARDDDGFITEVTVRFYEGEIATKPEDGVLVTRYRRSAKLALLSTTRSGTPTMDSTGGFARRYTQRDFGWIKTDAELKAFCDQQLALDPIRTPIPEQSL